MTAPVEVPMRRSAPVRDALRRFYDRVSANDVASFDELVSDDPAVLVIGTAPGEWIRERDRLRFGFETVGYGLEPGPDPAGFEEGSAGWAVDEPTLRYPDGTRVATRLTAIFRREGDTWKLVHAHFSVGIPDGEVAELQRRWST